MERFDERVTLAYLSRLSAEHARAGEEFLQKLPARWHLDIPVLCRRNDGSFSKQVVAHALLCMMDPVKFPGCRRVRLLAAFMNRIQTEACHER